MQQLEKEQEAERIEEETTRQLSVSVPVSIIALLSDNIVKQ